MKTRQTYSHYETRQSRILLTFITIILVGASLFGQKIEILGDANISGQLEVMDTILFSDGTTLASACLQILQDTDSDTKIEVEQTPDEDIIRFTIAGNEIARLIGSRLELIGSGNSVFIGIQSGQNSTGYANVGIGTYALASNTIGQNNVAIGENSMFGTTSGDHNTVIGSEAGSSMTSGNFNVMIGHNAGYEAAGNGNVLIGNSAGEEATGNQLFIDNTATNDPLIYGEFDNNLLRINGKLNINNAYDLPELAGSAGQVMSYNGSGAVQWVNPSVTSIFSDTDGDTRIHVEKTVDEDKIRFDVSGVERMILDDKNLKLVHGGNSIFIGNSSGVNDDGTNNSNLFIGNLSGHDNTSGNSNVFLGSGTGVLTTTGSESSFFGVEAGNESEGTQNTFIGFQSGFGNYGYQNTFVGNGTGESSGSGTHNTYLGYDAGRSTSGGSGNVYIGHSAGKTKIGNNKLIIDNGDTSTPFIYGEFDNHKLEFDAWTKVLRRMDIVNNTLQFTNMGSGDTDKGVKFGSTTTGLIGLTFENNGAYQDKLHFKTFYDQDGDSFMTLDGSNHNIGIKNTDPLFPLHVNGESKFEGSMQINEANIAKKGLHSVVSGLSSSAVRGDATSNGNSTNYGGYFTANGTNGHAVVGIAGSLVGNNYGGYFRAWGDNGIGIYANANGGLWSAQLFGNVEANGDIYIKSTSEGSLFMHGRIGLLGRVLSRNNGDGVMYLGDVDDTGTDVHLMESGEEAITIKNGGKVGIGTISPNFSLDVFGEEANDHIMRIRNKANSSDADGLLIDLDYSSPGSENNFITFESNNNVAGRIEGFQWNPAGNFMDYPDVNFEDYFDIDALNSSFEGSEIILENLLSCIDPLECPPSSTFPFTPTCQECQEILSVATFTFNNLWQPTFAADVFNKVGPVFEWNLRNGILDMANGPFDIAMRASPEYWNRFALEGDGGVTYGSKGADYAEWLEREDPSINIKAGQIVGVRNGKISLDTEDADQIMVISVMPVVLGNMPDSTRAEDFEKVAFIGQSPVWVVGEVKSGDYIIASGQNDGYGLAVSQENLSLDQISKIVGKAWEDGDRLINRVNMAVGLKTNEMATLLTRTSEKVDNLEDRLSQVEAALGIGRLAEK